MKKVLTISILAALVLCGCQKEAMQGGVEDVPVPQTFTASIADGATKTALGTGGNAGKVLWQKGDLVSVWTKYNVNRQYKLSDKSAGGSSGTLEHVSSPDVTTSTDQLKVNLAYYPYSEDNKLVVESQIRYKFETILPMEQYISTSTSFGNGAFPMVGLSGSSDTDLTFKNVLGGVRLQLKGTARIKKIVFSGNNREAICQGAEVSYSLLNKVPEIKMVSDVDEETITLNCYSGFQLNPDTPTSFIIALPPMTMSKGFTFWVYDTDGGMMAFTSTKEQTIERSKLLVMPEKEYSNPFTITSVGKTSVSFEFDKESVYNGQVPTVLELEYSMDDGISWTAYEAGKSIDLTGGQQVRFRSSSDTYAPISDYMKGNHFVRASGEGQIKVSGDIRSLLCKSAEKVTSYKTGAFPCLFQNCTKLIDASKLKLPDFVGQSCYASMFNGCTSLTAVPALPAKKLASSCYQSMFKKCTSLTTTPALPAETLGEYCYASMFEGCTSLTTAPALPAENLAQWCYDSMFKDCKSLTIAPALPAENLENFCYARMFRGCSILAKAPALPAGTLKRGCYESMFVSCNSLAEAPVLPATTLAIKCYASMFGYCIALKKAPVLPATTLVSECYSRMFEECDNIAYIEAMFTEIPTSGTSPINEWVKGIASSGTFVMSKAAEWKADDNRGVSGIPNGWTVSYK